MYDTSGINLDIRFNDDNFTIGSTLLRHFQRNGTNTTTSLKHPSISNKSEYEQKQIERPTSVQSYSDDYENSSSTTSSMSIQQQQTPQKPRVIQQPVL
ncbi:unnamed protein product, partial [Rotaria sp. Silwood1]